MTASAAAPSAAVRRVAGFSATRWIVLVAFLIAAWFALGGLSAATLAVMVLALYYAAAGTSFSFLFGSLGVFSLAQPVFVMVGGYTSTYLFLRHGTAPWISMLIAMAAAGVLAIPIGFIAMRRSGTVVTALVTLILSEAAPPIISAIKPLGGSIGLYLPVESGDHWWDLQFATGLPFARILLVMNVVFIAGLMWFARSRWGGWTTAIRDSEVAARAAGIPVLRVRITIFVVSAMMAALPGVVYAQYNLLTNTELFLGTAALFQVLVVALVGGADRAWGTIVGAVLMIEISQHLSDAAGGRPGIGPLTFAGAFLILALVLPRGITGGWAALQTRGSDRGATAASSFGTVLSRSLRRSPVANAAGHENSRNQPVLPSNGEPAEFAPAADDRPSAAATNGDRRGSE